MKVKVFDVVELNNNEKGTILNANRNSRRKQKTRNNKCIGHKRNNIQKIKNYLAKMWQ